jgi:hypothetical protein
MRQLSNFRVSHRIALMFECFDTAYWNVFISHISRYFMSLIRTFRDTFCERNHQYVVQASEKNQRVESSLFRSSNSIIKEYDLFEENVTKEVFDTQFSIQKKWDDNDFTNHVSISKAMLRVFVWRASRIFRFESNSWIVFLLFVQNYSKRWKYECARRRLCESSSISNYLSLFDVIHVLNFRYDLFISST